MARLTMEEKYRIQQHLLSNKDINFISKELKRSTKAINGYINNELRNVVITLSSLFVDSDNVIETSEVSEPLIKLQEDVVLETIHKLRRNGITEEDAKLALKQVEKNLTERIDDAARLAGMCLQKLNLHKSMIKEAVGGRTGVTAMTRTASEIADAKKKNMSKSTNRIVEGCTYSPKTGNLI